MNSGRVFMGDLSRLLLERTDHRRSVVNTGPVVTDWSAVLFVTNVSDKADFNHPRIDFGQADLGIRDIRILTYGYRQASE